MIRVGDIKTIQELRALQVISDLDFTLAVNKRESNKLEVLKKIFGLNYIISNDEFESSITKIIKTNHEKPVTSILSISKPLIFSKKNSFVIKE